MHRVSFAVALLLFASPVTARAQGIDVAWIGASPSQAEVKGARSGLGAAVHLPFDTKFPLRARLSVQRLKGSRSDVGSTCVGLVPIGANCAPGPENIDADIRLASAGVEYRFVRLANLDALADAELSAGEVHSFIDGPQGFLEGRKKMYGASIGAELAWRPVARIPVAIVGGAQIGQLSPFTQDLVVDGYAPFNDTIRLTRYTIGLGWRPRI